MAESNPSSIISDEESFVILGTSPLPSIKDQSVSLPSSNFTSLTNSQLQTAESSTKDPLLQTASNTDPKSSTVESKPPINITTAIHTSFNESGSNELYSNNGANKQSKLNSLNGRKNGVIESDETVVRANSLSGNDVSLAASFILGEINADVLKTSVYSQFPSVCSMEACAEDVVKLQNFMSEYIDLKKTLAKVNLTMKQFYNKTQQWKENMERMEEQYKQQLQDCNLQIAALRNENIELKRDVENKIVEMKIADETLRKEHTEIVKALSEKTALHANMLAQIEKLEQQQLASFEYVSKNDDTTNDQREYVSQIEHQSIVKEFERKLSELLAENLDLKDVQKQYIDEITCLKVNLTAAEELINQSRSDICLLKAKDIEKTSTFVQFEKERETIKEELALLRQQVEVYSKDFEMERSARQNLAGEKDQLLQDLRALQRKNQGLIEEQQKHWEAHNAATASVTAASSISASSSSTPATVPAGTKPAICSEGLLRCPVCSKVFDSVRILQSHVNDCLDKN